MHRHAGEITEFNDFQSCQYCEPLYTHPAPQPADYLYVYKGSEIWLKDSLDIPSAGFLIGKIRLEK